MSLTQNNLLSKSGESIIKKRNISIRSKTPNYLFVFFRICILSHGSIFVPFTRWSKGINSLACLDWKEFKIKQVTFVVFGLYKRRQAEGLLFSLLCFDGTLLHSGTRTQYTIIWLFSEKPVYWVKIALSDNNGVKFTMLAKHVLIFNQAVV